MAAATYLLLKPQGEIPLWPWLAYPGVDKAIHFGLYLIMATLWAKAFQWKFAATAILLLLHGLITELAQGWLPIDRQSSLADLVADAVGAAFGLGLTHFFSARVK